MSCNPFMPVSMSLLFPFPSRARTERRRQTPTERERNGPPTGMRFQRNVTSVAHLSLLSRRVSPFSLFARARGSERKRKRTSWAVGLTPPTTFLLPFPFFPSRRLIARAERDRGRIQPDMGQQMPNQEKGKGIMVGHPMSRLAISFTTQQINS